jgi:oligosaccharide repeat unit polymerase
MKLLNYVDLIDRAWFIIIVAFISFLLGNLTFFFARMAANQESIPFSADLKFPIFNNKARLLLYALLITSIISLFAAIQNWIVLIKLFGSLETVLIKANLAYKVRIHEKIPGLIPYIATFSYSAVVLSGIYSAYKNRITLVSFLPFLAVLLKSLAMVGRVGLLMAMVLFISSYFLTKNALNPNIEKTNKIKFSNKKTIVTVFAVIIFIVGSATLVKSLRGTYENFQSASKVLKQTRNNAIISPSIYLYLSSHVGVLSEYLYEDRETASWGENTFAPIYNLLSKFDLAKPVSIYLKGYYIPMWTNTGTYLREIYADFGDWGVFLIPYLLGLFMTFLWFKFYQTGNIYVLTFLIYFYLIISLGFFTMVTRDGNWFISLFILLLIFPLINKSPARLLKEYT